MTVEQEEIDKEIKRQLAEIELNSIATNRTEHSSMRKRQVSFF